MGGSNKITAVRRRLWIKLIPRIDLNVVHSSLQLALEHPMTKRLPETLVMENLADALWNESVKRAWL